MSETHDLNVIESQLSISQQINWILDNIYQNYKQGFNTLKEVLILLKNGHNLYDKYQIDHYNTVIDSVEKNIALWENQYGMQSYLASFSIKFCYRNAISFRSCSSF